MSSIPICRATSDIATAVDMTNSKRKPKAAKVETKGRDDVVNVHLEPSTSGAKVALSVSSEESARARFVESLITRLRGRETADGIVYLLDLRAAQYQGAPSNRITLRCPTDPRGPEHGATTSDKATAVAWIRDYYGPWLWLHVTISRRKPDKAAMTLADGGRVLLGALEAASVSEGQHEGTFLRKDASLVSMVTKHVIPLLGSRLLTALDSDTVHEVVNTLQVDVRGSKGREKKPAAAGTKRRLLAAFHRVWDEVFPTSPAPFAGAFVVDPKPPRPPSTEVRGFDDHDAFAQEANGAVEPSELLRLLAAAMYLDERLLQDPKTRASFIPNTPHTIAVSSGYGTRISETALVRWGHLFTTPVPHLRVHSAKVSMTNIPIRAVPRQLSVDPWLAELEGRPDIADLVAVREHYNVHIIRTDPHAPPTRPGTTGTLSSRVSDALELAGLKVDNKATHGFRATFISMGMAFPFIDAKTLQMYAGHNAVPKGYSTETYLKQMLELMKPEHQELIVVPTPEQARAELERCRAEFDAAWVERLGRKA